MSKSVSASSGASADAPRQTKAILNHPLIPAPRFSFTEAESAGDNWRFNCGPGALCAVLGMTPDEIRPHLQEFEEKGYTNPTMMFSILNGLEVDWRPRKAHGSTAAFPDKLDPWPDFGLVRVQWEGPWTAPGVPIRARYRHTHWIGCVRVPNEEPSIFDVNAMAVGGWIPLSMWRDSLVPWILKHCAPQANGGWHLTHVIEVARDARSVPPQAGEGKQGE